MADPYLIPDTLVLRNKLGITDADELAQAEYEIVEASAAELLEAYRSAGHPLQVSMHAWRTVHKALFRDVYDWAGEYRSVFISKENFKGKSNFCAPDRIGIEGERALAGLKASLRHLGRAPFSNVLDGMADAYVALNEVHPFREGNGRSQKVFFTLVARRHGIQLNWGAIDPAEHNVAAIEGSYGELSRMRGHFRAIGKFRPGD